MGYQPLGKPKKPKTKKPKPDPITPEMIQKIVGIESPIEKIRAVPLNDNRVTHTQSYDWIMTHTSPEPLTSLRTKPLKCECCGAPMGRKDKCEYCDTIYV